VGQTSRSAGSRSLRLRVLGRSEIRARGPDNRQTGGLPHDPSCEEGLLAGDVGTIVHIHKGGVACEVEFITLTGRTVAVATVEAG